MSCMLLSARHVSTVAHFVTRLLNTGYNVHGFEAPYELRNALHMCHKNIHEYSAQSIYTALYRKNLVAYNSRYKDSTIDVFIPEMTDPAFELPLKEWIHNEKGRYWKITPEHFKMLKLLSAYTYQLDEGITHGEKLTKAMLELERVYTRFIATNCEEYACAEWVI